jgi:hypothetical protein
MLRLPLFQSLLLPGLKLRPAVLDVVVDFRIFKECSDWIQTSASLPSAITDTVPSLNLYT